MRQMLRAALKAGPERIAVVCGAWHAPALAGTLPTGRPPTRARCAGLAEGEGRADLGAVDPRRGWRRATGYGAGIDLARLVPPPVHRPRPAGRRAG